jgi:uncharacterized protein YcfJ
MNYAIATLTVCIPMLSACLNDEPRIVQIPAAASQIEEPRVMPVISAIPNYSAPKCHTESVPVEYEETVPDTHEVPNDEPRKHSVGGALLGGTIGTALLSQVGGGLGAAVALGIGLIGGMGVGGYLGGDAPPETKTVTEMKTEKRIRYEQQEICEKVNEASREVENYTVTFIYKGQPVTTVMPYNPGSNLVLGMAGNMGR